MNCKIPVLTIVACILLSGCSNGQERPQEKTEPAKAPDQQAQQEPQPAPQEQPSPPAPQEPPKNGQLLLAFVRKGLPEKDFSNFSLASFGNGFWNTMNVSYRKGENLALFELAPGQYLFESGIRNKNGEVYMILKPVDVKPGMQTQMTVSLDIPFETMTDAEKIIRPLETLPEVKTPAASGAEFDLHKTLETKTVVLTFLSAKEEPSVRMLPMVQAAAEKSAKQPIFVGIITGEFSDEELKKIAADFKPGSVMITDPSGEIAKQFQLPRSETGAFTTLPSVLIIDTAKKIRLWTEGYDLNIETVVTKSLEE